MQQRWVGKEKTLFPSREQVLTHINELRKSWALKNAPVFHITLTHHSDGSTLSRFDSKLWNTEGSPEAEIIAELAPWQNEIVLQKHRYSAFHQTSLLAQLRQLQVTDCVITGYQAKACILATAMDSYQYDFNTHVVAEAILETDQKNLDFYKNIFREAGLLQNSAEFLS